MKKNDQQINNHDYSVIDTTEYSRLIRYTVGILNNKGFKTIEVEDVVHNSFIAIYDKNEPYSFTSIVK